MTQLKNIKKNIGNNWQSVEAFRTNFRIFKHFESGRNSFNMNWPIEMKESYHVTV